LIDKEVGRKAQNKMRFMFILECRANRWFMEKTVWPIIWEL